MYKIIIHTAYQVYQQNYKLSLGYAATAEIWRPNDSFWTEMLQGIKMIEKLHQEHVLKIYLRQLGLGE